jgi:hypothetical protein
MNKNKKNSQKKYSLNKKRPQNKSYSFKKHFRLNLKTLVLKQKKICTKIISK